MVTYEISPGEVETTFLAPPAVEATATNATKGILQKRCSFTWRNFHTRGYRHLHWYVLGSMGSAMRIFVTLGIGYILLLVLFLHCMRTGIPEQ